MGEVIRGLAICPGVGGLELGIELALGPSYQTVAYVERDPYVAGVLAARMQDGDLAAAPVWDDVATFEGGPWGGVVDLISAGFPCQPFSQAGKRESTGDPRYLWDDIARVIGEVGPSIVFLENVPGLLTARFVPDEPATRGEVFGQVLADLAALGYVGAWRTLRAGDVGAPHRRDRVFILAVASDAVDWARNKHGRRGGAHGEAPTRTRTDGAGDVVANTDGRRCSGIGVEELLDLSGARGDIAHRCGSRGQWGPDGPWSTWATEPDVGRVVDGVAARVDLARSSRRSRLRATGNGCVPQQAAVAFVTLARMIHDR